MRSVLVLCALLAAAPASAACQCVCVGGRERVICGSDDLVQPICQRLCTEAISQRIPGDAPPVGGTASPAGGSLSPEEAAALAAAIGR